MELNDRKRIGQVKEMVLNEARVMAMTFQIKANYILLDVLANFRESGSASLLHMHDANSGSEVIKHFSCSTQLLSF